METKLIEIRDRATFIPAIATKFNGADSWLFRRAGFQGDYIVLMHLQTSASSYDPYDWGMSRTMREAHLYLLKNWDEIKHEDLVDVEFILNETETPKDSERWL